MPAISAPIGSYYTAATQAIGLQAIAVINAAQGYPKPGVDVGGGTHVTPEFVTTNYCDLLQHPTLTLFALVSDPITDAALAGQPVLASLTAPAALAATWAGATVVAGT